MRLGTPFSLAGRELCIAHSAREIAPVGLLVVGDVDLADPVQHPGPAEEKLGREISLRVFSKQEFAARLKSKDRFLTSVVRGPKQIRLGQLA